MAQKYIIQLVDDLTNEPIDDGEGESVRFALDGANYMIDLSTSNAAGLRTALGRYVDAGRKAEAAGRGSSNSSYSSASRSAGKTDLKEVREWANKNGFTVSSRGRIPSEVQTAFDAR
jgi:hypothetical protein